MVRFGQSKNKMSLFCGVCPSIWLVPHGLARLSTVSTNGPAPEALKRELEIELRADKNELGSYAWYHGPVPRNVAENLVRGEGEFLVRESTSTGEYVITCKWHSAIYHFKVNTHVIQTGDGSKAQFSLEDELFESVHALVRHHVANKTPISSKSGAIISHAIDRNIPLSYADKKYASLRRQPKRNGSSNANNNNGMDKGVVSTSLSSSPTSSVSSLDDKTGMIRTPSPMHYSNASFTSPRGNFMTSSPYSPNQFNATRGNYSPQTNPGANVILTQNNNQNTLTKKQSNSGLMNFNSSSMKKKINSFPLTLPDSIQDSKKPTSVVSPQRSATVNTNNNNSSLPLQKLESIKRVIPPKPSRVPSFKSHTRKNKSNTTSPQRTVSPSNHTTPVKPIRQRYTKKKVVNENKRASCFKPLQYKCVLISNNNGPLDKAALAAVKSNIMQTDPFKLARHITVMDCKVSRVTELELDQILLPSGKQLRIDIMERYQCTGFWVVSTLVNADTTQDERVDLLNVFVQTANELVHSLGNIFGFAAIMHGLTSPQVLSLTSCWSALQIKYTNNSVTFHKKLRPLLKYMDEGKGQISIESTCIPHLLPLLRLLENPHKTIHHASSNEENKNNSRAGSFASLLESTVSSKEDSSSIGSIGRDSDKKHEWWENLPNDSFDSVMSHLLSGRQLVTHSQQYSKNCNVKLQDFKEVANLREISSTDFQLRLLFGHRGAEGPKNERYAKFDKILTALVNKILAK